MNKKDFALDIADRTRVIYFRNDMQIYITQDESRE